MGWCRLCCIDVAFHWNDDARLAIGTLVGHESVAEPGTEFVADPVGPVVQSNSKPTFLRDGFGDAKIIAASQRPFAAIFLFQVRFGKTRFEGLPGFGSHC